MSIERIHLIVLFGATAWATVFLALGARSLFLAYRADYGLHLDRSARWRLWRWRFRKRPGINGRSALDID